MPGGNPVIAVPGLTPRLPWRVLGPVLVTVSAARTENGVAVPRSTAVAANAGDCCENIAQTRRITPDAALTAAAFRRGGVPVDCFTRFFCAELCCMAVPSPAGH